MSKRSGPVSDTKLDPDSERLFKMRIRPGQKVPNPQQIGVGSQECCWGVITCYIEICQF